MLDLAISHRVAVLTLNRPSCRNALSTSLVTELERQLTALDRRDDVGAVVLTGAPPSFCAGSDLKELGGLDVAGMVAHEARTASVARLIGLLDVPVVAAVEGHALGGGFILAISCDLVVSADRASWRLPEVSNGWLPPWGLKALRSRVGVTRARRLVWGLETLDGRDAVALGVADYATEAGGALGRAREIGDRLASLPRPAVRSAKRFFRAGMLGEAEVWDAEAGRTFAENCLDPAAMRTLQRFAPKP